MAVDFNTLRFLSVIEFISERLKNGGCKAYQEFGDEDLREKDEFMEILDKYIVYEDRVNLGLFEIGSYHPVFVIGFDFDNNQFNPFFMKLPDENGNLQEFGVVFVEFDKNDNITGNYITVEKGTGKWNAFSLPLEVEMDEDSEISVENYAEQWTMLVNDKCRSKYRS